MMIKPKLIGNGEYGDGERLSALASRYSGDYGGDDNGGDDDQEDVGEDEEDLKTEMGMRT